MTKIDRDAVAEEILKGWEALYLDLGKLLKIVPESQRRHYIKTLREAHDLLQRIAPSLRIDRWIPTVKVQVDDRNETLNVADFLAGGALLSIADWLDRRVPKRGPPATKGIIAQAALELSEISRAAGKKPDWKWVEIKLKEIFGADAPTGSSLRTLAQKARKWKLAGLREQSPTESFKLLPDSQLKASPVTAETFFTIHNIRWQRNQNLAEIREIRSKANAKRGRRSKNPTIRSAS